MVRDIFWNATDYKIAKQWLIFDLAGMNSYLDRLIIQVIFLELSSYKS